MPPKTAPADARMATRSIPHRDRIETLVEMAPIGCSEEGPSWAVVCPTGLAMGLELRAKGEGGIESILEMTRGGGAMDLRKLEWEKVESVDLGIRC